MAWLIPVLLIASAVGLVVWPSISHAFMPPGPGPAPQVMYFNPAVGDMITIVNTRAGAEVVDRGFAPEVQREIVARVANYGYQILPSPLLPGAQVITLPGGMTGVAGQFVVAGKTADVALPSDLGSFRGPGMPPPMQLPAPGLFVIGVEQSPVSRGMGGGTPPPAGMGNMGMSPQGGMAPV